MPALRLCKLLGVSCAAPLKDAPPLAYSDMAGSWWVIAVALCNTAGAR